MKRIIIAGMAALWMLSSPTEASARQCIQWQVSGQHWRVPCKARAARTSKPFRAHRRHSHRVDWRGIGQRTSRPAGWPRAWCGAWMAARKGINDRKLWLARAWANVGQRAAGPAPGVIGVMRHHVYEVIDVVGPGLVLAISGNDGNAVRTRVRSTRSTIAWRRV